MIGTVYGTPKALKLAALYLEREAEEKKGIEVGAEFDAGLLTLLEWASAEDAALYDSEAWRG